MTRESPKVSDSLRRSNSGRSRLPRNRTQSSREPRETQTVERTSSPRTDESKARAVDVGIAYLEPACDGNSTRDRRDFWNPWPLIRTRKAFGEAECSEGYQNREQARGLLEERRKVTEPICRLRLGEDFHWKERIAQVLRLFESTRCFSLNVPRLPSTSIFP